ncbi:unnamed protein product, partial [marine sediment metagenome]
ILGKNDALFAESGSQQEAAQQEGIGVSKEEI